MITCRRSREDKGSHTRESRAKSPAFLFAPQFRKSCDNHPHAGRKNRGGQRRLPQIPLLIFRVLSFPTGFCVWRHDNDGASPETAPFSVWGIGTTPSYLIRCRPVSATKLSWGMKMCGSQYKGDAGRVPSPASLDGSDSILPYTV